MRALRVILYGFPSGSQLPAGSSGSGRNRIFSSHTERGPSSQLLRIWAFDWLDGFHFLKENFRTYYGKSRKFPYFCQNSNSARPPVFSELQHGIPHAALIVLACTIGDNVEIPVNSFRRKQARRKSAGVPHPRGCTLKRKRTEVLGEELIQRSLLEWSPRADIPRVPIGQNWCTFLFLESLKRVRCQYSVHFSRRQPNSGGEPIPPPMRLSMTLRYVGGGHWNMTLVDLGKILFI